MLGSITPLGERARGRRWGVTVTAYVVMPVIALFGIPAVITLAILKHGLYQIDVIINRAIRYGLLSAALTAIYVLIVVGIGTLAGYAGGPLLNVAAALAIAVLFQPLRRRAQLLANRIVYGRRATPYQVLADFAQDMAGQLDAGPALERMAPVLAGATGAVRVEVWVRVGVQLRPQVTWPPGSTPPPATRLTSAGDLPVFGVTRAIAVRHGASRGRSRTLWTRASPVTRRSSHGQASRAANTTSGKSAPPQNGLGTRVRLPISTSKWGTRRSAPISQPRYQSGWAPLVLLPT